VRVRRASTPRPLAAAQRGRLAPRPAADDIVRADVDRVARRGDERAAAAAAVVRVRPVGPERPAAAAPQRVRARTNAGQLRPPSKGLPDPTLARFLDVFHHRLLSLFWRARADAEPAVEADRPREDRFAQRLLALAGFRSAPASAEPWRRARRFWVGHLSRQSKNAEGLASILRGFFRFGVRIEQFVGRWLPMPGRERCRLGSGASALGRNAFLGDEIWNCTQTIRIACGPLDRRRYDSLLPGGTSWRRLCELVRDYLGDELAWEALLVQRRDHVSHARLDCRVRLGWTAWLGDTPAERDRADLVLQAGSDYRHRHEDPTEHE
jgi:type VI secretion system protein ImpH